MVDESNEKPNDIERMVRAMIEDARREPVTADAVRRIAETIAEAAADKVEKRFEERLKGIGLDLTNPAETATKIMTLFSYQAGFRSFGKAVFLTVAATLVGGFVSAFLYAANAWKGAK